MKIKFDILIEDLLQKNEVSQKEIFLASLLILNYLDDKHTKELKKVIDEEIGINEI